MDQQARRVLAIATAGTMLLLAADQTSEAAGQSRASLTVVVRVVAACGGSTGSASVPAGAGPCPAGSAPLAILTETARLPGQEASAPTASIEELGDVRYLTLIY
jgi:hypothetical protein